MYNPYAIHRYGQVFFYSDELIEMLIAGLRSPNWNSRLAATRALVKIGAPAVRSLISALRNEERSVWMLAATALVKIGKPAVPDLLSALGEEDESVQILVSGILVQIGDTQTVEGLQAASRSENPRVRDTSEIALVRLGKNIASTN